MREGRLFAGQWTMWRLNWSTRSPKENDQKLYSIDHHKGSEEQQPGEEYFDPDLRNKDGDGIDTLPFFLETIEKSGLEGFVIPIVSTSEEAYEDLNINFDLLS